MDIGSVEDKDVLTFVYFPGSAVEVRPAKYTVQCEDYTPTDDDEEGATAEWSCRFKIGSWTYDGFTVSLSLFGNYEQIDLSTYVKGDNLQVVSTSASVNTAYYSYCPDPYTDVTFVLNLRQKLK